MKKEIIIVTESPEISSESTEYQNRTDVHLDACWKCRWWLWKLLSEQPAALSHKIWIAIPSYFFMLLGISELVLT